MNRKSTRRAPVVSGLFYPDEPGELDAVLSKYLGMIDKDSLIETVKLQTGIPDPESETPLGIIVPHAGFIFSGKVQAHAYKLIEGKNFNTAVVVGPAHQKNFNGLSVNLDDAYETPLGLIQVNLETAHKLISFNNSIKTIEEAHLQEHSIEVQLPYIQKVLPGISIVPVLLGTQHFTQAEILADTLTALESNKKARNLVIITSDLSHYHPWSEAEVMDSLLMEDFRRMETDLLYKHIKNGDTEACGFSGILALMIYAKKHGKGKSAVLTYKNSGEISGDRRKVVGYMAGVVY